jgi:DNA polymerase IV
MKDKLAYLAGVVFDYMKKSDNFGRTVTLKIKSAEFKLSTRSRTFSIEVTDLEQLTNIVYELLDDNREEVVRVRLLGVSTSNLQKEHEGEGIQLKLEFE